LKQVLLNLLSNAVKYNRVGGRVIVDLPADNARFRISISDEGAGIPPDKRARSFRHLIGSVRKTQKRKEPVSVSRLSKRLTEAMGGAMAKAVRRWRLFLD